MSKTTYTFERQQFFRAYIDKGQVKISRRWGFVDGYQLFLHRGHRRTFGRIVETWTVIRTMISIVEWKESEAEALAALARSIEHNIKSCREAYESIGEQRVDLKLAQAKLKQVKHGQRD